MTDTATTDRFVIEVSQVGTVDQFEEPSITTTAEYR
jgi:hypothetical protein